MAKVPVHQFDKREKYRITGELLEILSSLRTREEMFGFLFRLLTQSEVLMLSRRLQIAIMLIEGAGYESIRKRMNVSHRTISDVEKWLNEDEKRKNMIENKIKVMREKNEKKIVSDKTTGSLLDKYKKGILSNIFD